MAEKGPVTVSETLFEAYLLSIGVTQREYQKTFEGTEKHPDYTFPLEGQESIFHVKQFEARPEDFDMGFRH